MNGLRIDHGLLAIVLPFFLLTAHARTIIQPNVIFNNTSPHDVLL